MNEGKAKPRPGLRGWAKLMKGDILALFLALKHPQTPLAAKFIAALVVGYALSPIDFIPDFIPVLGYIDDIILLPVGIALTIRFIPENVLTECRQQAALYSGLLPKLWLAATVIILLWLGIAYRIARLLL